MHDIRPEPYYNPPEHYICSCGAILESDREIIDHMLGTQDLPVPYETFPNQEQ